MSAVAITGGASVVPDEAALPDEDAPAAVRARIGRVERISALALLAASAALDDASACAAPVPAERAAMVLGTAFGCFLTNAEYQRRLDAGGPAAASPRLFAATVSNAAAGEVAIALGLRGPGVTLTAGRVSGGVALGHAAAALAAGRADAAIAGGADAMGPALTRWIAATSFGVSRAAVDAAAFLVLEPLEPVRRGARVRGMLCGHAAGFEPTVDSPDAGRGLAVTIARAIDRAGIRPGAVDAIVSTVPPSLGALEARALASALGRHDDPRRARIDAAGNDGLAASGPHAVLQLLDHEPAGVIALVIEACASGHVAACVVETGGSG